MFEELLKLTGQTVATLSDALRKWLKDPYLKGVDVLVTIPVGFNLGVAEHGLQRAMNGAIIVGVSGPFVVMPTLQSDTKRVAVFSSTVVTVEPLKVKVRVY